ncbi:cation channel sperm-associated auxiliary subunit delta-like [Diadema antillarum]|uniref:cation channel sperm-associated auxiliary subunit delta-like n=1 Tax=Diadema antillarum TaxID=105358 RepID=UPI003A842FE0
MSMLDISETLGPFSAIIFNNRSNIVAMDTKNYDLPSSTAESRALVHLFSYVIYPAEIINSDPAGLPHCPFLMFARDFASDVFYIDMRGNLTLQVSYIPAPWTKSNVMVFSSDPSILSINTTLVTGDPICQGNHVTKVVAEISLAADHADSGITEYTEGSTTITITTAESSLTCNESPTVQAFVVAGCPPGKTIRQRKQVKRESCDYLRNYAYRFNRDEYDPTFMESINGIDVDQGDLELQYDYGTHGCPDMSYFSDVFKPSFDLYIDDEFVEVIEADFALIEIHGVHNYDYRLNSMQAGCTRRPQSWVEMLQLQNDTQDHITAWNRVNYRSCIESGATPLEDKHAYQVMGSRTGNGIVWMQVNTIYVFNVTVLDPRYSYCHLRTQFAVEVYGALPPSAVSAMKVMLITCLLGFVGVAIVFIYYTVQIKDTEEEEDGQRKSHAPQFPH